MSRFVVRVDSKAYYVNAKDSVDAVKKVRDERLSPMTYKKLKELGCTKGITHK